MKIKKLLKEVAEKVTSYLNKIKMRIYEIYLNLFVAEKDEYYSYEKPSEKQMRNKEFWIQIEKEDKN